MRFRRNRLARSIVANQQGYLPTRSVNQPGDLTEALS
jgi:hypothetical protein